MTNDERAIRDLIATWMKASMAGDTEEVLRLMSDDVVFMVAGREPFGKAQFASDSAKMKGMHFEAVSDVKEVSVVGDWAYARSHLAVRVTLPDGKSMRRTGHTLSIFGKQPDGSWVLTRDANMLALATE